MNVLTSKENKINLTSKARLLVAAVAALLIGGATVAVGSGYNIYQQSLSQQPNGASNIGNYALALLKWDWRNQTSNVNNTVWTSNVKFIDLAVGHATTCVVKENTTVWCWGWDAAGQLGDGTIGAPIRDHNPKPVLLANGQPFVGAKKVTSGDEHVCALTKDGTVWCWGSNSRGELGNNGQGVMSTVPRQVLKGVGQPLDKIEKLGGASGSHTCAIEKGGQVWCWGLNSSGQTGSPGGFSHKMAKPVTDFKQGKEVNWGARYHTCAVKTDNTAWCWGFNHYGQLGNLVVNQQSSVPTQVKDVNGQPFTNVKQVLPGGDHTVALKKDGTVWHWGAEFGFNRFPTSRSPVAFRDNNGEVVGGFTRLSYSYTHICGQKADSTVWCWGTNLAGSLGDGTLVEKLTPVQVMGANNKPFKALAVGSGVHYSCAIGFDQNVWCWGWNGYKQLGQQNPAAGPLIRATSPMLVNIP